MAEATGRVIDEERPQRGGAKAANLAGYGRGGRSTALEFA